MITDLKTIMFNRKKDDEYEMGILFNNGSLNIIDGNSEVVRECWNYYDVPGLNISNLKIGTRSEINK